MSESTIISLIRLNQRTDISLLHLETLFTRDLKNAVNIGFIGVFIENLGLLVRGSL